MSQMSRHRFAYAPLREVRQWEPRSERISPAADWHASLSGKSAIWFDAVSIVTFALIGAAMTWYASLWVPGRWWNMSGTTDPNILSMARVTAAAASGTVVFLAAMIAARFGLVEMPRENGFVLAMKFAVAAMLGCGVLYLYQDASLGFAPMVGLTMLSLVLLFRMEPADAIKTSLTMGLVSVPILHTLALV